MIEKLLLFQYVDIYQLSAEAGCCMMIEDLLLFQLYRYNYDNFQLRLGCQRCVIAIQLSAEAGLLVIFSSNTTFS